MAKSRTGPAESTAKLIGGRWKIVILWYLFQDVKRFSELQRALTGVSQKVLTQQLRDMERDGIVTRTGWNDSPVFVHNPIFMFIPLPSQCVFNSAIRHEPHDGNEDVEDTRNPWLCKRKWIATAYAARDVLPFMSLPIDVAKVESPPCPAMSVLVRMK